MGGRGQRFYVSSDLVKGRGAFAHCIYIKHTSPEHDRALLHYTDCRRDMRSLPGCTARAVKRVTERKGGCENVQRPCY